MIYTSWRSSPPNFIKKFNHLPHKRRVRSLVKRRMPFVQTLPYIYMHQPKKQQNSIVYFKQIKLLIEATFIHKYPQHQPKIRQQKFQIPKIQLFMCFKENQHAFIPRFGKESPYHQRPRYIINVTAYAAKPFACNKQRQPRL